MIAHHHNLDEKYAKLALTFFIVALFILLFFVYIKVFIDAVAAEDDNNNNNNITSKVIKVVDGDTIDLESGERIRLAIANTPERGQEGWKEAKQFTKDLCLNKEALIDIDNKQDLSYKRIVAAVYCEGEFLNKELIENGHATIWTKFCFKSEFKEELCSINKKPYQFVKCPDDTNTYPEDTDCDIADTDNDDDDKSEKATEEEEKAMDKAKDD